LCLSFIKFLVQPKKEEKCHAYKIFNKKKTLLHD
jgi:hypothetical protein